MLKGRDAQVAIVTGAGRGIGKGCAEVFARAGYTVFLAEKDEACGRALEEALRREGLEASFHPTDVTREADIDGLIRLVRDRAGRLDALVNNAGTHIPGNVTETTSESWDFILTLNLKSVFLFAKHALPLMRASGGGAIVNMASMTGLTGQRDGVAYSASKGGIIALSKSLALDHGHEGVRVNCLCPGNVDTPLLEAWIGKQKDPAEVRARVNGAQLVGRLASAQEVGRAALFLATEPFITGVALPVEGGATLGY